MQYTQVIFSLGRFPRQQWQVDLLKNDLLEAGYDSFMDTVNGFEAYCPTDVFSLENTEKIVHDSILWSKGRFRYSVQQMEDKDWNEEWEKTSPSVQFGSFALVRKATQPTADVKYDIIINPRQSFGTATHPTTAMIISILEKTEIVGRDVMDMGCGTGVLAILTAKMGAKYVEAIDIDEWAYNNARDNARENNVEINIKMGTAEKMEAGSLFDVFLANINLNILLDNIEQYSLHVKQGGRLIMSGFYEEDIKQLDEKASGLGLRLVDKTIKDGWAAVVFEKQI